MTMSVSEVIQDTKMLAIGAVYERGERAVILTIGGGGHEILYSATDGASATVGKVARCEDPSTIATLFRATAGKLDNSGEFAAPDVIEASQERIAEWVNQALGSLDS